MNQLQQRALARVGLSEAAVSALYDGAPAGAAGQLLRTLCESHERLRAELAGVVVLLKDREATLERAIALTDTGSPEFRAAFPPASAGEAWFPRESVPGWRVVERIRESLGG